MKGSLSVKISDSHHAYTFELKRNITILCGESGRGKTTLFDMVADYNRYGNASGIKIVCDRKVIAFRSRGEVFHREEIETIRDSLILIDEDSAFIRSQEFAEAVKGSSNYFLLITRCYLPQLPISVTEIYELTGKKNKKFKHCFTDVDRMYDAPAKGKLPFTPEVVITEDSKSGYQFYEALLQETSAICVSANGKSKIHQKLTEYRNKNVLIIADGAAFGSEIREVTELQKLLPNKIGLFLPESFEWLILKSGIVSDPEWEEVTAPENYVDSERYFSWEQYFTDLLIRKTQTLPYKCYSKTKLLPFYTQQTSLNQMKALMTQIHFESDSQQS